MDTYWFLAFHLSLMFGLSASQTTSTSCITCSSPPACGGCNVNADILTMNSTSYVVDVDSLSIDTILQPYLQFTAYSVTLTSLVQGTCIRHTISSIPLIAPFIVSAQSIANLVSGVYQNASAITFAYSTLLDDSYSSLQSQIGYESCTASFSPSLVIPPYPYGYRVYSTSASPASGAALTSATTTTESPASVRHINTTEIIIVSILVSTIGLMTLLLCFIHIRRYRKKRNQEATLNETNMASNAQLYVDRKAELGDEERRCHEMDAKSLKYEVDGEDRIFELPTSRDLETALASLQLTHEIGGLEHSQELEVPGNCS